MSKKQIIILLGFAIFVMLLLLVMGFVFSPHENEEVVDNEPVVEDTETDNDSGIPEFSDEVEENVEETKPERVTEKEDSETGEKEGGYKVVGSSSGYSPEVLAVEENTIISLEFMAEGGKYDFFVPSLGTYLVAEEGERDQLSFRVPGTGTYRFECRDYCPSSGKIYGKLVVKPK